MQLFAKHMEGSAFEGVFRSASERMASGDLKGAHYAISSALEQSPDAAHLHLLMSEILVAAGQFDAAANASITATGLMPSSVVARAQLAHCRLKQGALREALESARACLPLQPNDLTMASRLGTIFSACGEIADALTMFEAAAENAPNVADNRYNLATALASIGRFDDAEQQYDVVIARNPKDWAAYRNRSDLRKQTPSRNHIVALNAAAEETGGDARGAFHVHGALAKEYEDLQEHEKSWSHLIKSTAARRSLLSYNVRGDVETMAAIAHTFDKETLQIKSGYESKEPIFILGLPRSGSTLLERMIGSHSAVFMAGELQNFASSFVSLARNTFANQPLDKLKLVEKSAHLDFAQLGKSYLESTRPRTGHTAYFIDKMPLNFLYIGLIHRALPNAKIIHIARHPVDSGYAIFKAPFANAYPFSYDLLELADYYIAYQRLMDHWNAALPGRILTISYEALVEDPEQQLRHTLKFCGLDFEPQCLAFHENTAPSATASAAQIRQPIYKSSVEKWRNYANGLAPYMERLRNSGIDTF